MGTWLRWQAFLAFTVHERVAVDVGFAAVNLRESSRFLLEPAWQRESANQGC